MVVGALIVADSLPGSLSGPSAPVSTPPPQPARRNLSSLVGKDCSVTDMASMARDAGTALEMAKAIAKDDRSNAVALLASGKITPIEGGGKARH